ADPAVPRTDAACLDTNEHFALTGKRSFGLFEHDDFGRSEAIDIIGFHVASHLSGVVSLALSSATKTARRLAGSVSLAFSLTRCSLLGGSKIASPGLSLSTGPVAEFSDRIAPDTTNANTLPAW